MSTINELLTFAYDSAYESAYDLSQKKKFSSPKIYTAKGNLKKRWYVYFSFREPNSGKLKRMTPFYGIANTFHTKEERMEVLTTYRKVLLRLLKDGYDPYSDNTKLYESLQAKKLSSVNCSTIATPQVKIEHEEVKESKQKVDELKTPIKEAFEMGLKWKEKLISARTLKDYEGKATIFLAWLKKHHPKIKTIEDLSKKETLAFLNHILEKTSPRNRNNYRADLSSIMQVLEDNEIMEVNLMKKIPVLKNKPERNKSYSKKEQESIFNFLKENDPILLLYIKFISYGFLRPIEVCRLKIKDINLEEKTLQFKAKNSPLKTKIIPEILWNELPDLSKMDKEYSLFTPNQIGDYWDSDETNKRDYFSKRFKKVVKDHFGFGKNYGLYSFRHTFITELYRAFVAESSPFQAKSKLMQITGHTSMTALEKYLRDIDAELPDDYSHNFKL